MPYGHTFLKALENLEKVLTQCQETNLSLSNAKFRMLQKSGIVLVHFISSAEIQVDPTKIAVISNLPILKYLKESRSFLGRASYCRRFIENFTKITTPLFKLLVKDTDFF
jgi:hypothetical protein